MPTQGDTRPSEYATSINKAKEKKKKSTDQERKDVKLLLINYFWDDQHRKLRPFCKDFNMLSSYQTLQRIILNDKSLHDLSKQRSHSYVQVAAVKRINQLLSTKIEMPKRKKYQMKCCGIDIPELSSLFDKDPIFCNKHWNYCKATDNWHAQECPLSVPLEKNTLETVGWKFDGDNARCSACVIGKKNAMQRYSQKIKDGSCVTTVDSLLKKQVNDAFDNHVGKCNDRNEGIANLKNNEDFVESMKMLAAAKVNNVTCDEGKSLCRSQITQPPVESAGRKIKMQPS